VTGTRDLAILTGGNREMSLSRNRDSGISETEISKESQVVNLAHLINVGNSRTMTWWTSTFSTTLSRFSVTPMVIRGLFP